jgi:hypothetical protein
MNDAHVPELFAKKDRARRTEKMTRQLQRMNMSMKYLSFLTRRTERKTRQLTRMDRR